VDPYAGMPGRRLFVAVPLPDAARAAVTDVVDRVRAQPLPDGMRDVRWVRLDGLHLTLRFLGPTTPERLDPTIAAVARAAASADPITAELTGAGAFPAMGRPRALWIGLATGADRLGDLAATVGRELASAGWAPDERPFRAHLTLARSDGMAAGPLVADRLQTAMVGEGIACILDRLSLFETVTGGGPARYVPVAESHLGGAATS
jgi:RNA 2',3'-cyclic 3'-phosphodiesterase